MRLSPTLATLWMLTAIARADVTPTAALRLGGSYTVVRDDYVQEGEPTGVGPELELSAGARVHPRLSASAFLAVGQFTKTLGFENTAMSGSDAVETTYRHLTLGAGLTWRPVPGLFVGGAIGRAFVTEIGELEGDTTEETFRSTLAGFQLGIVVYAQARVSVQLSLGVWLALDPGYDHAFFGHVPLTLGVAWN